MTISDSATGMSNGFHITSANEASEQASPNAIAPNGNGQRTNGMRLRLDDLREGHAAGEHRDRDRTEDDRELVGDDLPDGAQAADERELALRPVRGHHDGDRADAPRSRGRRTGRGRCRAATIPGAIGITAKSEERRRAARRTARAGTPARPRRPGRCLPSGSA